MVPNGTKWYGVFGNTVKLKNYIKYIIISGRFEKISKQNKQLVQIHKKYKIFYQKMFTIIENLYKINNEKTKENKKERG